MPGTYSQILLHMVFSTKHREPCIEEPLRPRLYDYMGGIVRAQRAVLLAIGGMPDHVHLLVRWRTDAAISDLMRTLKAGSSGWVHQTFAERREFAWQEGYSVFSVSTSAKQDVERYIANQQEHHKHREFKDELLALLRAHGVEFQENYVFD